QIAVHDSLVVRGSESVRDAERILYGAPHRERAGLQRFPQRLPFEQLADQERRSFVLAEVVNRENVGMIQRGNGLRFLLKTPQPVSVLGQRLGENLDRNF